MSPTVVINVRTNDVKDPAIGDAGVGGSHMVGLQFSGDSEKSLGGGNANALKQSCDDPAYMEDADTASDTDDTASTSASGDSVVENPNRGVADSEDDNEDDGYGKVEEATVGKQEDTIQKTTEAVSKADSQQPPQEGSKPEGSGGPGEDCRSQVNSGGAADSATTAEGAEVGHKADAGNVAATLSQPEDASAKTAAAPSNVPAGAPPGGAAAAVSDVPRFVGSDGSSPVDKAVCLAAAASEQQQRRVQRHTLNNADTASEIIVSAVASVLGHLASLGCRRQRLTVFHATRVPQVSIEDYLKRIAMYFPCSDECLVLGLVYIDRVLHLHPDFVVSGLSIHRLLVTAITLSAKFHNDLFFRNEHYAKVAGLKAQELRSLEARFLQLIDWRLHVQPEEYQRHLTNVLAAYPNGLTRYQARNRVPGQ